MTAPSRPRRPAPPTPGGRPGVVAAAPRLAARRSQERSARRRARLRRVLAALAVLVPVAALAWLVLLSPVLAVSQVEVAGTDRLAPADVVAAAAVEDGTPLARIDVADVADRVRAVLPPAQDVRVRRVWPSTLRLQVTERTPEVGIVGGDGALLVDAAGVGFAREPALPAGVPRLEVAAPGPDDPATRAALTVLGEVPAEVREQAAVIRAGSAADVQIELTDGRTVVWGGPGEAAAKSAALQALLGMEGTVFDVSAPGIVVRR
ncbi:MAG TPA: FtsQ-type POTRA domain-containing protein [Mycobacteriales bacterium]|nr:FtsQ-type POTRA domain-containing protein [Mycobacteriales bacterium]